MNYAHKIATHNYYPRDLLPLSDTSKPSKSLWFYHLFVLKVRLRCPTSWRLSYLRINCGLAIRNDHSRQATLLAWAGKPPTMSKKRPRKVTKLDDCTFAEAKPPLKIHSSSKWNGPLSLADLNGTQHCHWLELWALRYTNVSTSTFPGNVHNNTKERCKMECT